MLTARRVVEDRLVQGRRSREDAHPVDGDAAEDLLDVEDGVGEHGAAHHQPREPAGLVAEGVEERVDDEVTVAFAQPDDLAPVAETPQRLRVREHGALRVPGRTRREEDVGDVVAADREGAGFGDVRRHLAGAGEEVVPRDGPRGRIAPQDDDRLERWDLGLHVDGVAEQRHVVGVEEPRDRDERAGTALAQDVRGLRALEPRVHWDEDRARRLQPEGGDDPLPHVGRPDRDAVAGLDAEGDERAGSLVRLRGELGIGERDVAVYDRLP